MSIDNVEDLPARVQYVASAAQTDFDYPFPIFTNADLIVDVDGVTKVLTTNYTMTGAGNDTGGTVTFGTPMSGGEIVTLYRQIAIERLTDIQQNGPWSSTAYNDEQDKTYLLLQQLDSRCDRSLRIPFTAEVADADIELFPVDYADKYLAFDSDGKPTPAALSSSTMTQSTIGQLFYPRTAAEISAGVTPTYYYYEPGDARRYGMTFDGTTDDRDAFVDAMAQAAATGGAPVELSRGTSKIGSSFTIPANIVIRGHGQGATILKRAFTGDFCTSFGAGSQLENFGIDGDTATHGAGVGMIVPASNGRQKHSSIAIINFVEECLSFEPDGGSHFYSSGSRYYTTGTVGSVAAVKGPSTADSAAIPRFFDSTESDGCTLFDFGACDHWWADKFYTNGLIFSSTDAFNVELAHMRCGALGGTITCKGDSHFITGVSAVAWDVQATSSIFDLQAPSWNITESGSAANNSITRTNPSFTGTLTASVSNPTMGNSTLTARVSRDNAWVDVQYDFTVGNSGFAAGSGTYQFSLPIAAINVAPNQIVGQAILTGGSAQYLGVVRIAAGASVATIYYQATDTTIGAITHNAPITWTAGDNLRFNCRYRVT